MTALELIEAVRAIKTGPRQARPRAGRAEQAAAQTSEQLAAALAAFASAPGSRACAPLPRTSRGYARVLLNARRDDFQVVVASWAPGHRSPIHDHGQVTGAVAALVGTTVETKYRLVDEIEDDSGGVARLRALDTVRLGGAAVTPIRPDDTAQLHEMANESPDWAATVHVYLTPIPQFKVYRPRGDGAFCVERVPPWFDAEDAWRLWEPAGGVARPTGS